MIDPPKDFDRAQREYDNQEPPEERDFEAEEDERWAKGDHQRDVEQDR